LLSTMHVQVCTLDRCCEYQRTHLLHARYKMCICAMYTHVYMKMYMYIYVCIHVHIYFSFNMSFLFRKVEDVTTISKPQ